MTDMTESPAPPAPWPQAWPLPPPEPPGPGALLGYTLYLTVDPDTDEPLAVPNRLGSCPCPLRGRRCWDCSMIAFGPPRSPPRASAGLSPRSAGFGSPFARVSGHPTTT